MVKPLLIIDNFDSFLYNLVDYFLEAGIECRVVRNDVSMKEITKFDYEGIVLSPGPGKPNEAGNMMEIIEQYHLKVPILGICLGHQAIAEFFGAKIVKAKEPKHGKLSKINCTDDIIFNGIPSEFNVVRYHSLIIDKVPESLLCLANTEEEEIMVIKHDSLPIYGIQYHPEAVLTEHGKKIIENWIFLNKIPN